MSQFGLKIIKGANDDTWETISRNLEEHLYRHSFILLRGFDPGEEEFTRLAATLGTPIDYAFGKILHMRPKEETDESQFTNAGMALHQDSILNKSQRARFLAFRCMAAPAPGTGGEILLTNNREALRLMPAALLERLRASKLSYKSNARGYYSGGGGHTAAIEQCPIIKHPTLDEEVLFIALDDPSDERRNYQSSFVDLSDAESDALMREIDGYLRHPRVLYAHAWREGDVLINDNFLTCHGRAAFAANQPRHLIRIALA